MGALRNSLTVTLLLWYYSFCGCGRRRRFFVVAVVARILVHYATNNGLCTGDIVLRPVGTSAFFTLFCTTLKIFRK